MYSGPTRHAWRCYTGDILTFAISENSVKMGQALGPASQDANY